MTIKQWKKIISISVIAIIIILLSMTVFFGVRYYDSLETSKTDGLIDVSGYSNFTEQDVTKFLNFFNSTDSKKSLEYQSKYPSLYVDNQFIFVESKQKTCYLTFDDGPTEENTEEVLDILKKYDVKATFFVIYRDSASEKALYKRIVDEGHTIAVHSASHKYNKIYTSVDAYLADFEKLSNHIESITGVKPTIFRFPGGSVNSYNMDIYQELIAEMIRRGYVYYDWNVSSGDTSTSHGDVSTITENVLNGCKKDSNDKIVLLHDGIGHSNTVQALPTIIEGLIEQGYTFSALDNTVAPVLFGF